MTIEEKIEREIWWMLQTIKELIVFEPNEDYYILSLKNLKDSPTIENQHKLLRRLEIGGILTLKLIVKPWSLESDSISTLYLELYYEDCYKLYINNDNFNQVYSEYENKYGYPSIKSNPETNIKGTIERQVQFTEGGDIVYDKSKLTNAKPKSIDFYFFQILSENFNEAVSYERLAQESQERYVSANNLKGNRNTSTPQVFCQQRKNSIKKGIENENNQKLFDKIIEPNKTIAGKPGYRMTNP